MTKPGAGDSTRRAFTPSRRRRIARPISWVVIGVAIVIALVRALSFNAPTQLTFTTILAVGLGALFWALAVLGWDLAVTWIDYVSGSDHLQRLRTRWRVPTRKAPRPLAPHISRSGKHLWWVDDDQSWMTEHRPRSKGQDSTPWWVTGGKPPAPDVRDGE